jgi:hypothetical protein
MASKREFEEAVGRFQAGLQEAREAMRRLSATLSSDRVTAPFAIEGVLEDAADIHLAASVFGCPVEWVDEVLRVRGL